MQAKTSPAHPSDVTTCKMSSFRKEPNDSLATVTVTGGEVTPFNFLGVFCDGIIAGGAAGLLWKPLYTQLTQ
ncbi:hypothetical protein M0R45_009342 [Rubus argutus]|uniref:Uncharacterized protein n=1 Tax=Rubus argutus TaxID=59490 RepID=A0AAW1Y465_RUBAR